MKNLLLLATLSSFLFNCSRDGLEGISNEEPLNYSNGKLSTGTISSTGLVAPSGFELSEIAPAYNYGMSAFYMNSQEQARYFIFDDFIIPQYESWNIENISFFVINPDPITSDFPVKNVVVEIYDGNPELQNSTKIYGDIETNRFKSATITNLYRITNQTTDVLNTNESTPVYKVDTNISNLNLGAGHYWFKMTMRFDNTQDWSCYIPRLPQQGNNESSFNAFYKDSYHNTIFTSDPGIFNGTIPVNYETPFQLSGVKRIN